MIQAVAFYKRHAFLRAYGVERCPVVRPQRAEVHIRIAPELQSVRQGFHAQPSLHSAPPQQRPHVHVPACGHIPHGPFKGLQQVGPVASVDIHAHPCRRADKLPAGDARGIAGTVFFQRS